MDKVIISDLHLRDVIGIYTIGEFTYKILRTTSSIVHNMFYSKNLCSG